MLLCVHEVDQQSINQADRVYHLDYAYSDDDSGPPSFWYYGVQRDFRNLQTKGAPKDAVERVGTVDLRGLLGTRCFMSPDGRHLYALYLHRGDNCALGHGEEELGFDMEIPPHYQLGVMQISLGNDKKMSGQTTAARLPRKDFALSVINHLYQ
uniref:Peptidase_S9_N domain-containing protein n=1 Tax=Globodera pallida TaxID=36090 RepID=A0A183C423_GLOPA